MIGAIIGDIVGSRFEWDNIKTKEFDFFTQDCKFTDDSVMTLAVAKAIIDANGDFEHLSKMVVKNMREIGRPYPNCGYGDNFHKWMYSDSMGPYNSFGNGAAMRVSPCGFVGKSLEDVKFLSCKVTEVTHNHPDGLRGAEAVAVCVFLARNKESIQGIRKYVDDHYYPMNFTLDGIRNGYLFNETCQNTVPQAIMAFLESIDFEDAIRNAVSIGGDSDTIAAITGGIAGAFYSVPLNIQEQALTFLDKRLLEIFTDFKNVYPEIVYSGYDKFTWKEGDIKICTIPKVKFDMEELDAIAKKDKEFEQSMNEDECDLQPLVSHKHQMIKSNISDCDILNLNSLLEMYNFSLPHDKEKSVKLVFHATSEFDFMEDFRHGEIQKIETYQREQPYHIFKNCTNIITFLQDGPARALFIGIYRINDYRVLDMPPLEFSRDLPGKQWNVGAYWYDMTREEYMNELVGRLVVDWGISSRAWHQWLRRETPKKIIEIYPRSVPSDFPGFDELLINHYQLKEIFSHPDVYRSWHKALESVAGVYLIVDTKSGKQYVGSAYGIGGFLGRWIDYAKTGHGGNKELKQYTDFSMLQFSILHLCSISKTQKEVCHYEAIFKKKLGSQAHGLNRN